MWQDRRLTFSWLTFADKVYQKDLGEPEKSDSTMDFVEMDREHQDRAEQVHSSLAGPLLNRSLTTFHDSSGRWLWTDWRLSVGIDSKVSLCAITPEHASIDQSRREGRSNA